MRRVGKKIDTISFLSFRRWLTVSTFLASLDKSIVVLLIAYQSFKVKRFILPIAYFIEN
jgi:type IV secretory pathway TrbL component